MSTVCCSTDDFYLTYNDQYKLASSDPGNKLLEFRGEPGTHDIALGCKILEELCEAQRIYSNGMMKKDSKAINEVMIPFYDKSLNNGRGDRAGIDEWIKVSPPFEIILFEGWSLGFKHLSKSQLERIHTCHYHLGEANPKLKLTSHPLSHLSIINENLKRYEQDWYKFLDIFVHIDAQDVDYVYQWRVEQERNMRSLGKDGMTDDEVVDFVNRYMPAYELYLPRLRALNFFCDKINVCCDMEEKQCQNHEQHYGRHLKLIIDNNRELVDEVLM